MDLQSEHEHDLTETLVGRPVVVVNDPEPIKAFSMRLDDDANTVAAMEVLAPGIGELIGGSQREEHASPVCSLGDARSTTTTSGATPKPERPVGVRTALEPTPYLGR